MNKGTKSNTNPYCAVCPKAHNALNGRYCNELHMYVEHAHRPQC